MHSVFFALLHRLRSTMRWSGMVATQKEDVAQHTFGVALIAHALAVVDRDLYQQQPPVEDILTAALLHDASESILTDVIAPVKKYNPQVSEAFANLEHLAEQQLLDTLPAELRRVYEPYFNRNWEEVQKYVHAADKIDALCKCKLEVKRGNQEFSLALQQISESVENYASQMPSVRYFVETFLPAFDRSIDEYRYLQ